MDISKQRIGWNGKLVIATVKLMEITRKRQTREAGAEFMLGTYSFDSEAPAPPMADPFQVSASTGSRPAGGAGRRTGLEEGEVGRRNAGKFHAHGVFSALWRWSWRSRTGKEKQGFRGEGVDFTTEQDGTARPGNGLRWLMHGPRWRYTWIDLVKI